MVPVASTAVVEATSGTLVALSAVVDDGGVPVTLVVEEMSFVVVMELITAALVKTV